MIWPPPARALDGTIVRLEPLGREHLEGSARRRLGPRDLDLDRPQDPG